MAQQEGVVARSRAAHEEVAEALQARCAALTRCNEAMAAATAERQARFAAWLPMLSAFGTLTQHRGSLESWGMGQITCILLLCMLKHLPYGKWMDIVETHVTIQYCMAA